jgi:hypothetical protein
MVRAHQKTPRYAVKSASAQPVDSASTESACGGWMAGSGSSAMMRSTAKA